MKINDANKISATETIQNQGPSVDLHADYNLPIFRDERITIGADVFNVFNFQSVTAVGEIEWTQWVGWWP